MDTPHDILSRFQNGDLLSFNTVREPLLSHMAAHLAELAERADVSLDHADQAAIVQAAFAYGCEEHARYLPQYATLEAWFNKHADSFALVFAREHGSRTPLAITIIFQYAPILEVHIQHRLGVIDAEDRSDLVSQSLLLAYERISAFDPERGMLESWLRRLITIQALTFLRRHHRGQIRGEEAELLIRQVSAPDLWSGHDSVSADMNDLRLRELAPLLDRLPGRTATVIRSYLLGESYAQIAEEVGITNGHVRVMIHRGRNTLQQQGEAIRLHFAGRSVDEIAHNLGVTPQRIQKYLSLPEELLQWFRGWLTSGIGKCPDVYRTILANTSEQLAVGMPR